MLMNAGEEDKAIIERSIQQVAYSSHHATCDTLTTLCRSAGISLDNIRMGEYAPQALSASSRLSSLAKRAALTRFSLTRTRLSA